MAPTADPESAYNGRTQKHKAKYEQSRSHMLISKCHRQNVKEIYKLYVERDVKARSYNKIAMNYLFQEGFDLEAVKEWLKKPTMGVHVSRYLKKPGLLVEPIDSWKEAAAMNKVKDAKIVDGKKANTINVPSYKSTPKKVAPKPRYRHLDSNVTMSARPHAKYRLEGNTFIEVAPEMVEKVKKKKRSIWRFFGLR
jgi:hypothetical protein